MLTSLNMIDTIMVGQLGDNAIAAVGIGNQVYFLLSLLLLGISSGCSIFVSQFFGNKDYDNIKNIVGLALLLSFVCAFLYFLIVFVFNLSIMKIFTRDSKVIVLGSQYLKLISLSYVITAVTSIFSTVSRSTENAKLPMFASFTAVILNSLLNYVFIFGVAFIKPMGVSGAALATLISRIIEFLIITFGIYSSHSLVAISRKHLLNFNKKLLERFMSQSGIIIIKDVIWGAGATVYAIIYARMGTPAIASINLLNTFKSLAFVLIMGLSNACIVMVGKKIGENNSKLAYEFAIRFRRLTIIVSLVIGSIFFMIRPILLKPFNISPLVYNNAFNLLMIFSITFVFEAFNMISVMGILRSGGDTKFCLYMDIVAVWLIGFVMAFIGGVVFKLNIEAVYAMVLSQELFKGYLLYKRVHSKKWINRLISDL